MGWSVTDAGRISLERGEKIPVTREDVGQDEISKFRYFGSLAQVSTALIEAAAEELQNLDMRSMDDSKRVMADMNVPQLVRQWWEANYMGYLRNTTPAEERNNFYPLPEGEAVKVGAATPSSTKGPGERESEGLGEPELAYVVDGSDIHRVGEGLGEFTLRQVLQAVAAMAPYC